MPPIANGAPPTANSDEFSETDKPQSRLKRESIGDGSLFPSPADSSKPVSRHRDQRRAVGSGRPIDNRTDSRNLAVKRTRSNARERARLHCRPIAGGQTPAVRNAIFGEAARLCTTSREAMNRRPPLTATGASRELNVPSLREPRKFGPQQYATPSNRFMR